MASSHKTEMVESMAGISGSDQIDIGLDPRDEVTEDEDDIDDGDKAGRSRERPRKILDYIHDVAKRSHFISSKTLRIFNLCTELNERAGVEFLVQFQVNVKKPVQTNVTELRTPLFDEGLVTYPEELKVVNDRSALTSRNSKKFTVRQMSEETSGQENSLAFPLKSLLQVDASVIPWIEEASILKATGINSDLAQSSSTSTVREISFETAPPPSPKEEQNPPMGDERPFTRTVESEPSVGTKMVDAEDEYFSYEEGDTEFIEPSKLQSLMTVSFSERDEDLSETEIDAPKFDKLSNVKLSDQEVRSLNYTREKRYLPCEFCDRKFSNSYNLNKHAKTHTEEEPTVCPICNKRFYRLSTYKHHMLVHSEDKPHKCDLCNKRFKYACTRKVHMKTAHIGEKAFKCDLCDERFTTVEDCNAHFKTHAGEKNFKCDICDKRFAKVSNRDLHVKTHIGEKTFRCYVCDGRFTTAEDRKAHVKTHLGEKIIKGGVCVERFTSADSRAARIKAHMGEKTFKCDICDRRFAKSCNRDTHVKTHNGEVFKCYACDESYATAESRDKHVETHTGVKTFKCDVCEERFTVCAERDAHVKTHAGDFACDFSGKLASPVKRRRKVKTFSEEGPSQLADVFFKKEITAVEDALELPFFEPVFSRDTAVEGVGTDADVEQ